MSEFRRILDQIENRRDVPAREESFRRFKRAYDALAPVVDPAKVILVAGTNGKGSVAKTLEILLASVGFNVGLFTSPHIIHTTERIRSFGSDLTEDEFVRAFRRVEPLVNAHGLSHFETLTLMAAGIFFEGQIRNKVDWAVFEVGVGGLFDPTNAVPHSTAVITKLGFDHREILGSSLEEIARHKFGIIGGGNVVVHSPFPEEIRELARTYPERSKWVEAKQIPYRVDNGESDPRFFAQTPWGEAETDLPGRRGAENIGLALQTFSQLGFDSAASLKVLARVGWPGRMETFRPAGYPCAVHLSGDHNEQGVESLLELLPHYPCERLHWIVGIGARKASDRMLELYASVPGSRLNLTVTPFRGAPLSHYGEWLKRAEDSDENALALLDRVAKRASAKDRIVVSGSLYMLGAFRSALLRG